MTCEEICAALRRQFDRCEETQAGSRVVTHCLYPSFTPVFVFVAKVGSGYKVHDGSGAYDAAWLHGRDDPLVARELKAACSRFHVRLEDSAIVADVDSHEWLPSAIIAVANASSIAANAAVAKIQAVAEEALTEKIERVLTKSFGVGSFRKGLEIRGKSGGGRHFDFAIGKSDHPIYINGVAPHGVSVASKYVAFSDTDVGRDQKFGVYDRPLDTDQVALLSEVALIVPLASLDAGARRAMMNAQ